MADKKISELTAATSLDGTELLPVVQSGETKKAAMTAIAVAVRNYLLDSGADLPYGPDYLFSHGEQGAWYDPSDLTAGNMYQDSAKTTAVTAVEQPVGWIQDKSGRGNHASQPASAARPVLSARYNLLTNTEDFGPGSGWGTNAVVVTPNAAIAPNGTNTANLIANQLAINDTPVVYRTLAGNAGTYSLSVYAKAGTANFLTLGVYDGTNFLMSGVNLITGVADLVAAGQVTTVPYPNGWWKCSLQYTYPATTLRVYIGVYKTSGQSAYVPSAVGADNVYIWGADLRVANDGVGLPDYQRVAAATDYDTTGFPLYLKFDGVDDCLYTPSNIDFTATDKMTVWAGVRKLSDATSAVLAEIGTARGSTTGTFTLLAPGNIGSVGYVNYGVGSNGGVDSTCGSSDSSFASPNTAVLSAISDMPANALYLRGNGLQIASSSSDQGTGNFGNYPLYIGRRGNSSLQWNGRLYSLIVRGAESTGTQITQAETYVNNKAKAY